MGKLARLNAEKKAPAKEVFITAIKVENSYEIQKEKEDGTKVVEKVDNLFYIPLSTGVNYVSWYTTKEEAENYLKVLANSTADERAQQILFSKKYSIMAVKYAPTKKTILRKDWTDKYLLREVEVVLKKYKSSKQL